MEENPLSKAESLKLGSMDASESLFTNTEGCSLQYKIITQRRPNPRRSAMLWRWFSEVDELSYAASTLNTLSINNQNDVPPRPILKRSSSQANFGEVSKQVCRKRVRFLIETPEATKRKHSHGLTQYTAETVQDDKEAKPQEVATAFLLAATSIS